MPSPKEIRGRIKSVKNTRKITRAMELISTVKMKKAQDAALGARPFAVAALRAMAHLSHELSEHPLFRAPERHGAGHRDHKTLFVVFTANKGLCGSYNVGVFRELAKISKKNIPAAYVTVGRKGREFVARTGGELVADFSETFKDAPDPRETKKISRLVQKLFRDGACDSVEIIYNWYVSALTQKVVRLPLLPLDRARLEEFLKESAGGNIEAPAHTYAFEPSAAALADAVVPMAVDHLLHEDALEAKASEHAARMVAMKSAKDNAGKKVSSLTTSYNKARQGAITKEITEIVSGVESLKD